MSGALLRQFLDLYRQVDWPQNRQAFPIARLTYEKGLDAVNLYRGNPEYLRQTLGIFLRTNSRPYAFAGASYILAAASYLSGTEYDPEGLNHALIRLQEAQHDEPHLTEINLIEPLICIYAIQLPRARALLDTLDASQPASYLVCLTELRYWYRVPDTGQFERWYRSAMQAAATAERQICLLDIQASFYMALKDYPRAIQAYETLGRLTADDPWLWHNISVMYYRMKQYDKAATYNRRALALMDFESARKMEQDLKDRRPVLYRLLGRN